MYFLEAPEWSDSLDGNMRTPVAARNSEKDCKPESTACVPAVVFAHGGKTQLKWEGKTILD